MRICRVCLGTEENLILSDGNISSNLSFVCGISFIEHGSLGPAMVCSKCANDLTNAAKLKKVALLAELYFKKRVDEMQSKLEVAADEDYEELIEYVEDIVEEFIEEDDILDLEIESTPLPVSPKRVFATRQVKHAAHQCECGLVFASSHRLKNHIRVKHEFVPESELLPCEMCGKKFKIKEYLELHIKNQHTKSPVKQKPNHTCAICGKILSSLVTLKNHEEKHLVDSQPRSLDSKKFHCDICGNSFRLKSYCFNHMHNVHIRRKYLCNLCERGFYKKYEMNDHIRQHHTGETPFHCEFQGCTKSFSRKKNYLIHKRIHTGERPYPCTFEGCDKAFMHYIDRKRHLMKHTGERPFKCNQTGCCKGFMRKTELDSHLRSHPSH